jgi:hypothetical protein
MSHTTQTAAFTTVTTRLYSMALAAMMTLGTLGAINGIAQYEAGSVGAAATVDLAAKKDGAARV